MKEPFGPSRKIEIAYERGIHRLFRAMLPTKRPDQSYEEWVSQLGSVNLGDFATSLARQMAQWSAVENAKSWRAAAARSQKSRMLYRLLQAELAGPVGIRYQQIIRENANLIRSIPAEVAQHLSAHLAKAQQAGMRSNSVTELMRAEFPKLTTWKINVIARTEVAKAASALTEAKSRSLGLPAYAWDTSSDQRVRPSHRLMDGVIVFWDDPPAPEALAGIKSSLGRYHAGCCPLCRCGANPLLSLDDVQWPHKVHVRGKLIMMARAAFAQLSGVQERAAVAI